MKRTKVTLVAAAGALVAGVTPLGPAAPARAEANPAVDQCRALLPYLPASNLGECLSFITVAANGSNGFATHDCDSFEENDPELFYLIFVSKSECIRLMKAGQHGN